MFILKNNKLLFCDVDDTLVRWKYIDEGDHINISYGGVTNVFSVHTEHVTHLREHIKRGHGVIIWSQGGWEWAEAVVKALVKNGRFTTEEVKDFVIMDKPSWVYDDLNPTYWMPENQFTEIEGWSAR